MCDEYPMTPGIVPHDEIIVPPDPDFEAVCMSGLSESIAESKWRFGKSLFTKSEKWGLILRRDFSYPGELADRSIVNRVVCWRRHDKLGTGMEIIIAFGQRVKPL